MLDEQVTKFVLIQHLNIPGVFFIQSEVEGGGTSPSPIFFDNCKGGSPMVSPFSKMIN